eukprot:TRINITY_DN24463_c0_g1_i1.p1 TRINITY_DN24463_c0_g1~~TRINITY_DN24463_c0_g1_i1.p1  ORF type:complete len:374 (+),score=46.69 TRINITY_DN24463_c0_g1_i1:70-1191(+)
MSHAGGGPFEVELAKLRYALERRTDLEPYRFLDGAEATWKNSPAGTDASLRRFLVARKGDIAKAEAMIEDNLRWRRRVFPIFTIGDGSAADKILRDGRRFQRIGFNQDGLPVVCLNFQWGYFLEGVSALDCLKATLVFLEQEVSALEAHGNNQAVCICYGGPPPLDYAAALAALLEANYPERLARAVIYPVPMMVVRFVRMMLWFIDKNTRDKVTVEGDEQVLLRFVKTDVASLPDWIRGGLRTADRQMRPESQARMGKLMREGIYGTKGKAEQLQLQLLQKSPRRKRPREDHQSFLAMPWLGLGCCITRSDSDSEEEAVPCLQPCKATPPVDHNNGGRQDAFLWTMYVMLLVACVLVVQGTVERAAPLLGWH